MKYEVEVSQPDGPHQIALLLRDTWYTVANQLSVSPVSWLAVGYVVMIGYISNSLNSTVQDQLRRPEGQDVWGGCSYDKPARTLLLL